MKKLFSKLQCFIMLSLTVFAFAGCKEKPHGQFYSLHEVYEAGGITQEDLLNMSYYNNGKLEENADLMHEDFQPKPLAELTAETENKIKEDLVYYFNQENRKRGADVNHDIVVSDVIIRNYCGTYNGYITLLFDWIAQQIVVQREVAGVTFKYGNNITLVLWKEK